MSSTNRGGQRSDADNYPTPNWCVHRLLEDEYAKPFLPAGRWLEPGAGDGAIVRAVREVRDDIQWTALEYREECRTSLMEAVGPTGLVIIEDYLSPPPDSQLGTYDVASGNPPYRLAGEFVERSLMISEIVVLLLRVNYLASGLRNSFMRSRTPDVYVLPNRPSFRGTGTDSPEYAWFMWAQQKSETIGRLRVLATTPKEIRKAAKKNALPLVGKREKRGKLKMTKIAMEPAEPALDIPPGEDTPFEERERKA